MIGKEPAPARTVRLRMKDMGYCHSAQVVHDGYDSVITVTTDPDTGAVKAEMSHVGFTIAAVSLAPEGPKVEVGNVLDLGEFGKHRIVPRMDGRVPSQPNPYQPVTLAPVEPTVEGS